MAKRIFLTGGTGFIGRNFQDLLGDVYDIVAPSRSELDLSDSCAVEKFIQSNNFDAVVHCAHIKSDRKDPGPPNLVELNLRLFFNLFRCQKYFEKMICFGTGAEYDKQNCSPNTAEDDFDRSVPKDGYGFYKYLCSKYIENSDNVLCLRLFGCYGKYEDYELRFISNAICKNIFGLPITITNKNSVFSYLFVNDLINLIANFIENTPKYRVYNATPSTRVDLLTIARTIIKISGNDTGVVLKKSGMGNEYSGSNKRLMSEFPDFGFTPIDVGISKLYAWYQSNQHLIDKNKLIADRY